MELPAMGGKERRMKLTEPIKRFKLWNHWRKRSLDGKMYKVLVLFGISHSPTFEMLEKWG